jgi:hypothetical protein
MPCYADVRKDARGNAIYPYDGVTNSAIMFNNGHYFLLYNTNNAIKEEVINSILANKVSDEPIRHWQEGVVVEGGRIRKRKVITKKVKTHKQKPRTHKAIRHKAIRQKPRKQSLKKQ